MSETELAYLRVAQTPPLQDGVVDLLCIGNVIVDVFATVEENFCERHGINQPVQHIEIEKLSAVISDIPKYTTVSGGGSANVAKIAGFLGAKTCFTGATGADHFGQIFENDLAGVKLALHKKNNPPAFA